MMIRFIGTDRLKHLEDLERTHLEVCRRFERDPYGKRSVTEHLVNYACKAISKSFTDDFTCLVGWLENVVIFTKGLLNQQYIYIFIPKQTDDLSDEDMALEIGNNLLLNWRVYYSDVRLENQEEFERVLENQTGTFLEIAPVRKVKFDFLQNSSYEFVVEVLEGKETE